MLFKKTLAFISYTICGLNFDNRTKLCHQIYKPSIYNFLIYFCIMPEYISYMLEVSKYTADGQYNMNVGHASY